MSRLLKSVTVGSSRHARDYISRCRRISVEDAHDRQHVSRGGWCAIGGRERRWVCRMSSPGGRKGGVIRVPTAIRDHNQSKESWPSVEVGQVKSPEDAVFVDVDRDGAMDVISCCEGKTRTVYVHWAPHDVSLYWNADAWQTESIPVTADQQMWMFCLPFNDDSLRGMGNPVSLIVGSKGDGATVSQLTPGAEPARCLAMEFHSAHRCRMDHVVESHRHGR